MSTAVALRTAVDYARGMTTELCMECGGPFSGRNRRKVRGLCYPCWQRKRRDGSLPKLEYSSLEDRFWSKVLRGGPDQCWPWQANTNEDGYGQFKFSTENIGAHRVAYYLTHGKWAVPCTLHTCDNPPCCNPEHLYEGTEADNARDKAQRGRVAPVGGELNPAARLTEAAVVEARKRFTGGETLLSIAEALGVSKTTISQAVLGKTWAGVTEEPALPVQRNRGERNGMTKLTIEQVRDIFLRARRGESQDSVAKLHGVSQGTVSLISTRKTWRHVTENLDGR